jgi:hypothetical protein
MTQLRGRGSGIVELGVSGRVGSAHQFDPIEANRGEQSYENYAHRFDPIEANRAVGYENWLDHHPCWNQ